ncbi:beta-lactamase family protein [Aureobasidium sp. EXF-12298]|nr:beta-lactamase family protein [Aureobasidium sp. EXF-12298]
MTPSFEEKFEQAVKDGVFPGAIMMAKDKSGKLNYSKVFGNTCIGPNAKPLQLNSILFLASMTKLLTSIAAMQIIEKGLISLDTDIAPYLPELAAQPILHGFDDNDKPILTERKNTIKFVHLLTHSAGTAYDKMIPMLEKYRQSINDNPEERTTMKTKCVYPLLFEPGTYWSYGTGSDWAGKVIEKVTGQTLQQYMDDNIFAPLNISRIKFTPYLTEEMKTDAATIALRIPSGDLVNLPVSKNIDYKDVECFGGHGGYADLTHYFKILSSLLLDDEILLFKSSTDVFFSPQLSAQSHTAINKMFTQPEIVALFIGSFPSSTTYDWGVGGVLVDSENDEHRKKGTLIWSGMPNNFWWVDREKGVCGLFGTQVYPPGDGKVGEMIDLFEKEVYERVGGGEGGAKL